MITDEGLVSVGMPVLNGASSLSAAIDSLLNQTYSNLEIIISDNCSTDGTEAICREFARSDSRIRYERQALRLTALENFKFVFDRSHGAHFMWAAHDDCHSSNYIEVLRQRFMKSPDASIVFTDSVVFSDHRSPHEGLLTEFICDTSGMSFCERHRAQARSNCCHIYGLINVDYLRQYKWADIDVGPDHLMLHWLLCHGDFVYVSGATFYYYKAGIAKSRDEKAAQITLRRLRRFPLVRFAWACAGLIRAESERTGIASSRLSLATFFYSLVYGGPKHWLYENAPKGLRRLWHSKVGTAIAE